ncbi:HAMP domain-containing histidine kinase [Phormidium sp. CLA17]|uniref:sensor histidine kinase n=1 Tax=Leptolyngbya sp. Cla-17 TaxID=2803751 RepID=UPI001931D72F|nr:HAMP domain-containing sensor histidine kinase [Leptolyngbya sp. Cla-17]MBM0741505.1 HAMP domain-containing histidine kinase [Leptolyngbya sp. Cla-17]
MPISSEFTALCRSQVSLLTQAVGASISIVYINQEQGEGTPAQLTPIAVYPDGSADLHGFEVPLLSDGNLSSYPVQLPRSKMLPPSGQTGSNGLVAAVGSNPSRSEVPYPVKPIADKSSLANRCQIVLPLMHEEMMLGLLVTQRDDRPWTTWEEAQVQEVATSIAIACVLDQRYQWMARDRQQEHTLRMQQHDMMDNLLHQFRNSLSALQTFGKLMIKRLLPGDNAHDIATNMVREATRLKELSQQLELVAGINTPQQLALPPSFDATPTMVQPLGDAVIEVQTVPLLPTAGFLASTSLPLERCLIESVIEPLLASISTLAEGRGQTLHRQIPEDLPPVWAAPQALREVLHNLLENAVKYTPDNGHIFITIIANEPAIGAGVECENHQSWLEISITDTGFGIPQHDLLHLFERHYRGVQAEGIIPGSGLGLAIAKTLIEQMHGTIQVVSPADLTKIDRAKAISLFMDRPGTTFVMQLAITLDGSDDG